ncbi:hypothetical protein ACOME3_009748 [Neoechinorhynchus agilis]
MCMEAMRQPGGYLGPSHKQDRVFTHSSRLYSTGPSMYQNQQPSGRRRSVGPPSQYGRRPVDDYGHYGGGGGGGGGGPVGGGSGGGGGGGGGMTGQYYGGALGPRYGNMGGGGGGGGYQQSMRQPQQRYRRMPPQRRRVFSQGNDYRNPPQMRQQARRYVCDLCQVEFDTAQARSRHTRRAHPRGRRSTEGDQSKTQSAGSQTNQAGIQSQHQQNVSNNRRGGGGRQQQQQQDRRRRFVCQHCRAVFNSAKSITVHMKEHHPNGATGESATPANPAATTSATGEVTYITEDVNLHNCAYCPFAFMSAGELARHRARCRGSQQFSLDLKLAHPGNEGFLISCPLCRTMVNLAHGFKRHVDNVHPFARISVSYECALCEKVFDGATKDVTPEVVPSVKSGGEDPADPEERTNNEDKRTDDPIYRALEAVKAHMGADHTEEQISELKKQRAAVFAEQSLKAYERFQRRPGVGQGNRRRRFSQRNRRSTNTTAAAANNTMGNNTSVAPRTTVNGDSSNVSARQQSNEVTNVVGEMLSTIQTPDPDGPATAVGEVDVVPSY